MTSDYPRKQLNVPMDYMNSIILSGMPPHKVTLKVGAVVILIRNMKFCVGAMNGVHLIVTDLFEKSVKLEILTGTGKVIIIFIYAKN